MFSLPPLGEVTKARIKGAVLPASELGSCVRDEVDVLGSPSLIVIVPTVSVDVKQH